mgnify:CR=1 FL=1
MARFYQPRFQIPGIQHFYVANVIDRNDFIKHRNDIKNKVKAIFDTFVTHTSISFKNIEILLFKNL